MGSGTSESLDPAPASGRVDFIHSVGTRGTLKAELSFVAARREGVLAMRVPPWEKPERGTPPLTSGPPISSLGWVGRAAPVSSAPASGGDAN